MNPKDLVGAKKAPTRYVPKALVLETAAVMETGATKYGPFNWRQQPVSAQTYGEAIERHLAAWMEGQDNAEDSGLSHIAHIAASCGIILDAVAHGTLLDDRIAGPAADILRRLDKSAKPAKPCEHERRLRERTCIKCGKELSAMEAIAITPCPRCNSDTCPGRDDLKRCTTEVIVPRFLCGHQLGEEPLPECGTAVHWSRVNGIEEYGSIVIERECLCDPSWPEHSFDCPLFHQDRGDQQGG